MTPSPGPIHPHHACGPSRVIQGSFPGGRPRIVQASPAPAAPVQPQAPAPIQARPGSPPAPVLPGRPATGALQPALRPGQPPRPILPTRVQPATPLRPQAPQPILPQRATPTAVQPHAGNAFPLPGNFTLKPRGSGQPLPEPVQKRMEAFFNTSFADVRVHVGHEAPSIGALAFTHGTDLYFAPGQYNPQTTQGQLLLGHELTHVVQQRAGRVCNPLGSGLAVVQDPALESEAERMGLRAASTAAPVQAKSTVPRPARPTAGALVPAARHPGVGLVARPPTKTGLPLGGAASAPRAAIQRMMAETSSTPEIFRLPQDLLGYIASYLGAKDQKTLRLVSRMMRAIVDLPEVSRIPNFLGGIVKPTKQRHHPAYQFRTGEGSWYTYELDKSLLAGKDTGAATNIRKLFPDIEGKVRAIVQTWNCEDGIVDQLIALFIAPASEYLARRPGTEGEKQISVWVNPKLVGAAALVESKPALSMVKRLIAARETLALRYADFESAGGMPWNVKVVYSPSGKQSKLIRKEEVVSINWKNVLKQARGLIKVWLAEKRKPADQKSVDMKAVFVHVKDKDDGLARLYKLKLIKDIGTTQKSSEGKGVMKYDLEIVWEETVTVQKATGKKEEEEADWNFALGHLRFILFTEWKILHDLIHGD